MSNKPLTELLAETKAIVEAATPPDCGDNSCRFAIKKDGMRTNGGCRCYANVSTEARHYALRTHLARTMLPALIEALGLAVEQRNELLYITTRTEMDGKTGLDQDIADRLCGKAGDK